MSSRRPRDRSWPPGPQRLPVAVVDNHTHLDSIADVLAEGVPAPTVAEHLAEAARAGVTRVVQIGCDLPSARLTAAWVAEFPAMLGGVAIHPNEAPLHAGVVETGPDGLDSRPRPHHRASLEEAISQIADLARDQDRIRVIGETGLDRFRTGPQGFAAQLESFRAHIALAKELDLVMQIHDREAHAEVLEVLAKDGAPERTVFHCFSGDEEMARLCAAQGWYLSFAGPVSYPANDALRAALRVTPVGQILLETDAPYLPPHPYRGRPNAPYLAAQTMRLMAEIREEPLAELCEAVSATSEALYGPW